jgi:hypothetical protein
MRGPKRNPCIGLLLTAYLGTGTGIVIGTLGCVSETTTAPLTRPGPYKVSELEEWRVLSANVPIGRLVLLEVRGREQVLTYFRAESSGGQWVGRVARYGRFFKNEPFRPIELGPRDLGLYTMNEGLALLYEVDGPIKVTPMEGRGQLTEAAAHKLLDKATQKNR